MERVPGIPKPAGGYPVPVAVMSSLATAGTCWVLGKTPAVDRAGKTIRTFKGGDIVNLHVTNFFDAAPS